MREPGSSAGLLLRTDEPSNIRYHRFRDYLQKKYGRRIYKISLDAGFGCPHREGSDRRQGPGCTYCENAAFSPHVRSGQPRPPLDEQLGRGIRFGEKRYGARGFFAYFQAYTNTYADAHRLDALYRQALEEPDVVGLSVGTRPDCVAPAVLDLLCGYRDQGYEVWLELGLQSAFDATLERVKRGHGFAEYRHTLLAARRRGLRVCTHLIAGLPGEGASHARESLRRVLDLGVDGLKLHPLHVVRGTALANEWRRGDYRPLSLEQYVDIAADLVEMAPPQVLFHRITGTASRDILLAPDWCAEKWRVLNAITRELHARQSEPHRVLPVCRLSG